MTATHITSMREAVALQRALELAEMLDPLNEPLQLVKAEPFPSEQYVMAEVAATLGRICLQQREHITELGERVEALEARQP